MLAYFIRRLLYMVPILFGVIVLTFLLFNVVNTPDQMAVRILGPKASQEAKANWLRQRGYDKPTFWNNRPGEAFYDSQFFNTVRQFATFDLGKSDATGEPVAQMIRRGIIPSLCLTLPAFAAGLFLAVGLALLLVATRESALDRWGTVVCVAIMSVPIIVYVIFGQWVVANLFNYFPAFGFNLEGWTTLRFIALPVALMVVSGLGSDVRLYRAIFLEEIRADYIRTAQAKGATQGRVLFVHLLKNGMISLITLVVASLPFLIMGTLVVENFFGVPGLGNMMTNAISTSDFALVRANVFVGSLLFLFGLLITDLCYAIFDPRIRLQ